MKLPAACCSQGRWDVLFKIAEWSDESTLDEKKVGRALAPFSDVFSVIPVSSQQIREGDLRQSDALVIPGGYGDEYAEALGASGLDAVTAFVASGGAYIGLCAGAYLAAGGERNALPIAPSISVAGPQRWLWRGGTALALLTGTPPISHYLLARWWRLGRVFKKAPFCLSLPIPKTRKKARLFL